MEEKRRGQTSLEYLLVTVFALIIIAAVLMSFGQVNNSTAAIALIKSETLAKLNSEEYFYTIKKISGPETVNGVTEFIVEIEGTPAFNGNELADKLVQEIVEKNLYPDVKIEFKTVI